MAESDPPGEPIAAARCPWCSSPLDDASVVTCPHCGAALHEQVEGDLPGVTQIDALGLATQRRTRGKGVRALIGLTDEETEGSPVRSVPEPPSDAVRREMLRLRIDAIEAEIEARSAAVAAARAEAAARAGTVTPEELIASATPGAPPDAPPVENPPDPDDGEDPKPDAADTSD